MGRHENYVYINLHVHLYLYIYTCVNNICIYIYIDASTNINMHILMFALCSGADDVLRRPAVAQSSVDYANEVRAASALNHQTVQRCPLQAVHSHSLYKRQRHPQSLCQPRLGGWFVGTELRSWCSCDAAAVASVNIEVTFTLCCAADDV